MFKFIHSSNIVEVSYLNVTSCQKYKKIFNSTNLWHVYYYLMQFLFLGGIAGISSLDGRHLAMMPHPERCSRMITWPWHPASWNNLKKSPWQRIFDNAYLWCSNNA